MRLSTAMLWFWYNKGWVIPSAITAGLVYPHTRAATWSFLRWSATNVLRPIVGGYATAGRNLARGAVVRAGPYAAAAAAGVVLGGTVLYGTSSLIWGEEGEKLSMEFLTEPSHYNPLGEDFLGNPFDNATTIIKHYF